jgi:ubiquinone/menaquinone biosynthesis C-methylase UbiE
MKLQLCGLGWLNACRLALNKHFRRFLYNKIYYGNRLTRGLNFFNLGVSPIDPELAVFDEFSGEQHQAQVYFEAVKCFRRHALKQHPERVLEVSTGLGGGLLVLSKFFPDSEIFGLDYSITSIARSRRVLATSSLVVADAQLPPFRNGSFGFIVNVESFHALRVNDFLREARRILLPDGLIVIVDFRMGTANDLRCWLAAQASAVNLDLIEFSDLTNNAIQSCQDDQVRRNLLAARLPFFLRGIVNEMTAGEGADLRNQYETGAKTYFMGVFSPILSGQISG